MHVTAHLWPSFIPKPVGAWDMLLSNNAQEWEIEQRNREELCPKINKKYIVRCFSYVSIYFIFVCYFPTVPGWILPIPPAFNQNGACKDWEKDRSSSFSMALEWWYPIIKKKTSKNHVLWCLDEYDDDYDYDAYDYVIIMNMNMMNMILGVMMIMMMMSWWISWLCLGNYAMVMGLCGLLLWCFWLW